MYEVMLLFSVAVYAVVISIYLRSGLASLYHPLTLYLGFHGLVFVFRPILVYVMDYDFIYYVYEFRPSLADKLTALAAANLGFITFSAFVMKFGNVPMTFRGDVAHDIEREQIRKVLPIVLVVCASLGIYALFQVVSGSITGETTMVTKSGIRVNTTEVGYLSESTLMLIPVCALIAWFWRFRLLSLVPLAAFFVFKASSGGRGPFVTAVFAAALLYFYDRRIKMPSVRVVLIAVALGSVFSLIGQDRGYALREALGFENQTVNYSNSQMGFMEGQDFANMEYLEYIVYVVPQRSGTYDYFLSNLQLLTEPIPRVLWKDKPIGPPIRTIDWFEYGSPLGMTYSMPGMGWLQFGWIGVFVWCGLWGWALGKFYRWFAKGPQSALAVCTYLIFYALLIVGYRDGLLLTIARQGLFLMFPVALLAGVRIASGIPRIDDIRLAMVARRKPRRNEHDPAVLPRSARNRLRVGKIAGRSQR